MGKIATWCFGETDQIQAQKIVHKCKFVLEESLAEVSCGVSRGGLLRGLLRSLAQGSFAGVSRECRESGKRALDIARRSASAPGSAPSGAAPLGAATPPREKQRAPENVAFRCACRCGARRGGEGDCAALCGQAGYSAVAARALCAEMRPKIRHSATLPPPS